MTITYSKTSIKYLLNLDQKTRARIVGHIDKLPHEGDIKKLQGKKIKNLFRLRVGKFRVIYQMAPDIIKIVTIDNRGDVYK